MNAGAVYDNTSTALEERDRASGHFFQAHIFAREAHEKESTGRTGAEELSASDLARKKS